MKSLIPGPWLLFSLTYARGNRAEFLKIWRLVLVAAFIVPPVIALVSGSQLRTAAAGGGGAAISLDPVGKVLLVILLLAAIAVVGNLERTFRASVGLARWRIKYLFLGVGLIFGAKLYTASQTLLFSGFGPALDTVASVAVILGCALMIVGYSREGFGNLDIYPSRKVLQGSLTVLLAGAYLLVVGLLAQIVVVVGGVESFPIQALVLLLGLVGLAVFILSDRFRTGLQRFVSRHFLRPQYDFRSVWADFTRRISTQLDSEQVAGSAAELIAETFHVLGVRVFLYDGEGAQLRCCASTAEADADRAAANEPLVMDPGELLRMCRRGRTFNLERAQGPLAGNLRDANPRQFGHGGDRHAVVLAAGDRVLGVVVLADRVNGIPYSQEELELLECVGDQCAAGLLNRALTGEVTRAKELEAFRSLSAFFVHDLKNSASSLGLMLQNLPNHFDDPEFRRDAVRGIGRTVDRINGLIQRLSALRQELRPELVATDVNELVGRVCKALDADKGGVKLVSELNPLPEVAVDREQICSLVTNLVVNAREAVEDQGVVRVETRAEGGKVVLTVSDDGCGMSEEFVRERLFRPFSSTKSKGMGIGVFQCMKIAEAHCGTITVESEPGKGTVFRVLLPVDASAPNP